ncbi:hypothetical protein E2C01_039745 [Portunus trituberculatus]|uniref:Uncharacterized protein n=1 Tax=Portunus trituberculatus TaxID=210409 RepID=A0A5B7FKL3_PORTR|nr:hypothetical protein [Portunus trituberculatus]
MMVFGSEIVVKYVVELYDIRSPSCVKKIIISGGDSCCMVVSGENGDGDGSEECDGRSVSLTLVVVR